MMMDAWRDDLSEWLWLLAALLNDQRRDRICSAYVEDLLGLRDRKSVQPLAIRSPGIDYDQLHHFIDGGVSALNVRRPRDPRPC